MKKALITHFVLFLLFVLSGWYILGTLYPENMDNRSAFIGVILITQLFVFIVQYVENKYK
jgi:hypothetical protein